MDQLKSMEVFSWVATLGSFRAAADRMALAPSRTSEMVAALEKQLGTRLLARTTRRLTLTEEGQSYLAHCQAILFEVQAMQETLSSKATQAHGHLTVDMTTGVGHLHVLPVLPTFLKKYPEISTTVVLSNRRSDLLSEGVDVALRAGPLPDSSLTAQLIKEWTFMTWAAPSYLQHANTLEHPRDLQAHECLAYYDVNSHRNTDWVFSKSHQNFVHQPRAKLAINDPEALVAMACAGLGIVCLVDGVVNTAVQEGKLVRVLPDWTGGKFSVFALHPYGNRPPAKVKVFIEFLRKMFS
jgi:DNA-binding transcriptional LysR family regulator